MTRTSDIDAAPRGLQLKRLVQGSAGILLAFLLVCAALSIVSPRFLTVGNLTDVLRQAVPISVIAFGATFVIGMRGIDLSVGATFAMAGLVGADLMTHGYGVSAGILASLAVGLFIGLTNGLIVAKLRINDFIATLSTMVITRGAVMVYSQGIPIVGASDDSFRAIGQSYVGPIPTPVVITAVLFAICYYLLYFTRLGRYALSIGSNPEAARLVGIRTDLIKIIVYTLSGFLAAIAGILLTARLEAAMPEAGTGYELDVIAAVVIGGTGLLGGRASLAGTVIGAVLMAVVRNGLNLLNVNSFWHQVVIGLIILLAVTVDRLGRRASN